MFCFLSDAFPEYDTKQDEKKHQGLFEDFTGNAIASAQKASNDDSDLLAEKFTDYNLPMTPTKDVPQPFDQTSADYFKILNSNWDSPNEADHLAPRPAAPPQASSASTECLNVAKHLDNCSACRTRLEHIFRKMYANKPVTSNAAPWYLDLALLLLIGIFIVFVLDAFVRLGRYLRK